MKHGMEGLDLFHQLVRQLLPRHDGQRRNVIDGLFGIKLGALPARTVENVDQMRPDVEQAELEHREKPHGSRADNHGICLVRCRHTLMK
jgi:hypothetical protein